MAIKRVEVRECDFCHEIIEGHYYVYTFEGCYIYIPKVDFPCKPDPVKPDICTGCAEKISPVVKLLTDFGLIYKCRADSKVQR